MIQQICAVGDDSVICVCLFGKEYINHLKYIQFIHPSACDL